MSQQRSNVNIYEDESDAAVQGTALSLVLDPVSGNLVLAEGRAPTHAVRFDGEGEEPSGDWVIEEL